VVALVGAGARVTVANRTPERAEELAGQLNAKFHANVVRPAELRAGALGPIVAGADLIVNTTSLGMSPHLDGMPDLPVDRIRPDAFVYDLIYNPLETRLLREARKRGARGAHGAGMLARQGALALELWTGRPAPPELMERVILGTLTSSDAAVRREE
jgi:shikimate dehydrogenase